MIQAKEDGCYEVFLLELSTGLRRGELLALQWADLNFETGELRLSKQVNRIKEELTITKPKTKVSMRTIVLPSAVVTVFREYKDGTDSRWMFPSPVKEAMPLDPAAVRNRLHLILERAQCKQVRFHDIRHTFSTMALANRMDGKTLSAVLGHTSSATTLDIYTHITGDMQKAAAAKIDRGIGKAETTATEAPKPKSDIIDFQPYKGTRRKAGTGCITQISEHLWEGRYSPMWPDGKKRSRNIYAKTREECEAKLPVLIAEMKAEIKAIKRKGSSEEHPLPDGISKKKKLVLEYMKANPDIVNKSQIARETGVSRDTVQRYYDEIRTELVKTGIYAVRN